MLERPESLYLGWVMIACGAAIILMRFRLAGYQRDMRDLRRGKGGQSAQPRIGASRDVDALPERAILAAIGVLMLLGGLMFIVDEPLRRALGIL